MSIFGCVNRAVGGVSLVVFAFLCASTANAAVIFSNIDQPYGAYTATRLLGMEFIPSASGKLQSVELALAVDRRSSTRDATVYLYSGPQTGLLETWNVTVSSTFPSFSGLLPLTTLTSLTSIDLIAGNEYWVFMLNNYSAADPGVFWAWDTSPSGATYPSYGGGGGGYNFPGRPFNKQFGVRVNASIPEPFTLSLFGVGLAGSLVRRCRRKADT